MHWLLYGAYLVGAAFFNYLLRPNPEKPSPSDTPETPTADTSQSISIVWGTCKIQPNIFWWGDKKAREFYAPDSNNFAGYTYYIGTAMGLCWGPVDALIDIIFNEDSSLVRLAAIGYTGKTTTTVSPDLPILLTGNETGLDVLLDSNYLFGGQAIQGGIRGLMRFYFGTEDQDKDDYLDARISEIDPLVTPDTTPAYKRLCYAVFARGGINGPNETFYWGTTPSIKPVHFIVQRCPSAANGDATSKLGTNLFYRGYDANAAEILYEIYTDDWWGLKKTSSEMDLASFQDCAQTLFDQNLGISLQVDSSTSAQEVINMVEQHVDAVVYTHPTTGLITMYLLRADFVVADIPVINSDNSSNLDFHRPTFRSLASGVKVKWTNPDKAYQEDIVDWQNQAFFESIGEEGTEEVSLPGLTQSFVASAAADQIGRTITRPIAVAKFKMSRLGFDFHRGTPFTLDYPELAIGPIVMRVTAIDYGSFEDGEIEVSAVQDTYITPVFTLPFPFPYPPPPPTTAPPPWSLEFSGTFASVIGGVAGGFGGTNVLSLSSPDLAIALSIESPNIGQAGTLVVADVNVAFAIDNVVITIPRLAASEFFDGCGQYPLSTGGLDFNNFKWKLNSGGSIAAAVSYGRSSRPGLEINGSARYRYLHPLGSNITVAGYMGVFFRADAATLTGSTATRTTILAFRDDDDGGTGALQMFLSCRGDGRLDVCVGTESTVLASTAIGHIVAGVGHYYELGGVIHNTAGTYEVREGGNPTPILSGTSVNTRGTGNNYYNKFNIGGSETGYFVDPYFSTWGFLGNIETNTYRPNATGDSQDWTRTGGSTDYGAVGDVALNDGNTSYLVRLTSSGDSLFGVEDSAVSGSIIAVTVNLVTKQDGSSPTISTLCKSGGVTVVGTPATPLLQVPDSEYRNYQAVYLNDPATGAAWTLSGFNAAQFGARGTNVRVTQMAVELISAL